MNAFFRTQRVDSASVEKLMAAINKGIEVPFAAEEVEIYLQEMQEKDIVFYVDGVIRLLP